jgi:hypothetical protein
LPDGHYGEFFTEFWRDGKRQQPKFNVMVSRVGTGRAELRLRKGDSLSPEGAGKLRWDWRFENRIGTSSSTGGWIDDPFAETPGRISTWRGADSWELTPGKEHTVLLIGGFKENVSVSIPAYSGDPTELAERIQGENAHPDVELYLKVRVRAAGQSTNE